MKTKLLGLLVVLLVFAGCATVKVETGGLPVAEHVVRANVVSLDIRMDLAFIKYYGQPEGDEILETYEYLDLTRRDSIRIRPSNLRKLQYSAHVYNPRKLHYEMWIERYYYDESVQKRVSHAFEQVYAGNLSRKDFSISLPIVADSRGSVQFVVRDADGMILYQCPKGSYEIR